jgi:hypothetical protein
MKKKIISISGLALFVGAMAFNMHMSSVNNDQLSNVTLKNIEALAAQGDEDEDDDMTMEECVEQWCPFEGNFGCEAICDGYIMIIWYQWNGVYIL